MMDPDGEVDALREMIVEAVESCTDGPLLDLIYKLLVCSA